MSAPDTPLRLRPEGRCLHLELSAPGRGNPLNRALIEALHTALDQVEADPTVSVLTLSAEGPVFCDGMDFSEAVATAGDPEQELRAAVRRFHGLLERLARLPVIVAALVEGRVNAGGMGLVAACDVVYARPQADFGLSEILFGLLPATVTPFLVRRTGLQTTYRMALTAQRLDAGQARACGLVDELCDDLADAIRRLRLRADRLDRAAIARTKAFYADYAGFDPASCQRAENTLAALLGDRHTAARLGHFIQGSLAPWPTRSN
ncbi:polyketide biosynthesis enoyl-CoA hydratase PksH [Methylomagnum ishizawai]|uniref:Polyketide biosynthesis enoyl-CoA hydratase PksH n=1 Tax=Methylomagnum ishizawai TaxID=1760988 RepID=A0A1Y6D9F5_9GAMM|nr:enoyl-CoA hydratase-related protein [Methylomagnum ishizawai]SMF97333.1 polyketide biosynthesis enoyl-CoA hydratase PksH [Methylomagnum ishizawai]